MSTVRYSKSHEWVRVDGDEAVVGITDYAQAQLGDVVYVELPARGRQARQGQGGRRGRVGQGRERSLRPGLGRGDRGQRRARRGSRAQVNTDAEGEGWFFKIKLADAAELGDLLDDAAYKAFVAGLA